MPIIKSAKKRVKTAAKARARNARLRRKLRETFKAFNSALSEGKAEAILEAERQAFKVLDTAAKKNIIHKNKAARKKSQLAVKAKAANVKPAKVGPNKPAAKAKPANKKASKS